MAWIGPALFLGGIFLFGFGVNYGMSHPPEAQRLADRLCGIGVGASLLGALGMVIDVIEWVNR